MTAHFVSRMLFNYFLHPLYMAILSNSVLISTTINGTQSCELLQTTYLPAQRKLTALPSMLSCCGIRDLHSILNHRLHLTHRWFKIQICSTMEPKKLLDHFKIYKKNSNRKYLPFTTNSGLSSASVSFDN